MYKGRLRRLAKLLIDDAANPKGVKFDLSLWGRALDGTPKAQCGTIACAMGLAAVSGAFKKEGLYFRTNTHSDSFSVLLKGKPYGLFQGLDAAEKLFQIDYCTAAWLFISDSYSGKCEGAVAERKVARRILKLIDEGKGPSKTFRARVVQ